MIPFPFCLKLQLCKHSKINVFKDQSTNGITQVERGADRKSKAIKIELKHSIFSKITDVNFYLFCLPLAIVAEFSYMSMGYTK